VHLLGDHAFYKTTFLSFGLQTQHFRSFEKQHLTKHHQYWKQCSVAVDKIQCHVQLCLADGGHFQHWRKVIRFTMNSRMCHLTFISFRAHIMRLQASLSNAFYMNHLLILCDSYMAVKIRLALTKEKRLAVVTTTNWTEYFDWGLRNQQEWEKSIMTFFFNVHGSMHRNNILVYKS
jgi:hypothetical protein